MNGAVSLVSAFGDGLVCAAGCVFWPLFLRFLSLYWVGLCWLVFVLVLFWFFAASSFCIALCL
jgi:hypothetical protein